MTPEGPLYGVALTREGGRLLGRLAPRLPGLRALCPSRYASEAGIEGFDETVAQLLGRLWPGSRGFLLVMAAGIAVRSLAPLLRDKVSDPAVVVLDAQGRFAVPLLSGHLGGANELAHHVARLLGGTPVITTATDGAGAPAVEVWARGQGLRWDDRRGIIAVNAAWANGEPVGAYADPPHLGLVAQLEPHLALTTSNEGEARGFGGTLFAVSHRELPDFPAALRLRPRCLVLGVGCRKGADPGAVEAGIREALAATELSVQAAAEVVSVREKARELALIALAESLGVPFRTFPAVDLATVTAPTPSERVRRAVGTSSVSEAAAILATGGNPLVLSKVKGSSWTLAVGIRSKEGHG